MDRFSDERISQWWDFLTDTYGYAELLSQMSSDLKAQIRAVPNAFLPEEKKYGLLIPIVNKKWAICDANGVKEGALACFRSRFVIYSFTNKQAYSYTYGLLRGLEGKMPVLNIELEGRQPISIKFKLDVGKTMIWSFLNIAAGMSASGRDRMMTQYATRENSREANSEANAMIDYFRKIYSFFLEAMNGVRGEDNSI